MFRGVLVVLLSQLGGQDARDLGGSVTRSKRWVQAISHGQAVGRCNLTRRPDFATRAGTVMSLRRIVAVVALASCGSVRLAAARVRLNPITASTSHAAFAVNTTEGRCASAEFFRSAWTCSMIACPRWILSAVTVSRIAGSAVVKNAWNRHTSNKVPWPAACFLSALKSGILRTTSRPGTRSDFLCPANAVKSISATSAREIHRPEGSSNTASVYSIVVHAWSLIAAIAALIWAFIRTVTDTAAPPARAAW